MTAPVLCPDHRPVIAAMAEKVHTGDADVANAAAMFARCCLDCIPLQIIVVVLEIDTSAWDEAFATIRAQVDAIDAYLSEPAA